MAGGGWWWLVVVVVGRPIDRSAHAATRLAQAAADSAGGKCGAVGPRPAAALLDVAQAAEPVEQRSDIPDSEHVPWQPGMHADGLSLAALLTPLSVRSFETHATCSVKCRYVSSGPAACGNGRAASANAWPPEIAFPVPRPTTGPPEDGMTRLQPGHATRMALA